MVMDTYIDLYGMTPEEMRNLAADMGFPAYRGDQLFSWLYKGIYDFREMTNLPKAFLALLSENTRIGTLTLKKKQESKDGTNKYLFALGDGNEIESVSMQYKFGHSVCISSQAGCRMGCRFCASGLKGLSRNLEAGELTGQIMSIIRDRNMKIDRIVIMGTGEPFDNYDALIKFIEIIHSEKGLGIGLRNITVSTSGLVPMIERFSEDLPQVNLAVSLHAADDNLRRELMPISNTYPLPLLMEACRRYGEKTGRRISFEYMMLRGVNDSEEDLKKLCGLLKGMICHVNLIPWNPVSESPFKPSSRDRIEYFQRKLISNGISTTIRRTLGSDVDAACGQLRLHKKTD